MIEPSPKQIGRYFIYVSLVDKIEKQKGKSLYNVHVLTGQTYEMTRAEKKKLDEAMALHSKTIEVMHIIQAMRRQPLAKR